MLQPMVGDDLADLAISLACAEERHGSCSGRVLDPTAALASERWRPCECPVCKHDGDASPTHEALSARETTTVDRLHAPVEDPDSGAEPEAAR